LRPSHDFVFGLAHPWPRNAINDPSRQHFLCQRSRLAPFRNPDGARKNAMTITAYIFVI
jgi:hypothetical protein